MGRRGCAGEEVIKEAERVVPFQRDVFEGKPAFVWGDVGVDEERGEEGVEAGQEEGEVREAMVLDLWSR